MEGLSGLLWLTLSFLQQSTFFFLLYAFIRLCLPTNNCFAVCGGFWSCVWICTSPLRCVDLLRLCSGVHMSAGTSPWLTQKSSCRVTYPQSSTWIARRSSIGETIRRLGASRLRMSVGKEPSSQDSTLPYALTATDTSTGWSRVAGGSRSAPAARQTFAASQTTSFSTYSRAQRFLGSSGIQAWVARSSKNLAQACFSSPAAHALSGRTCPSCLWRTDFASWLLDIE